MGWVGYFLVALPNVLIIVAGVLLGLFPSAVAALDKKPGERAGIAVVLVVLAVLLWIISARQLQAADDQIASLQSQQKIGFQTIGAQISTFEAHTPTVPKLDVKLSDELATTVLGGSLVIGVNVTIANNGDDATFVSHYVAGVSNTPSQSQITQITSTLRKKVRKLTGGKPAILRHGESKITSAIYPIDEPTLNAIAAGVDTAYFAINFDIRSVSGKHQIVTYCSFYQGIMLVAC